MKLWYGVLAASIARVVSLHVHAACKDFSAQLTEKVYALSGKDAIKDTKKSKMGTKRKKRVKDLNRFHFKIGEASVAVTQEINKKTKKRTVTCDFDNYLTNPSESKTYNQKNCKWYDETIAYSPMRTETNECDTKFGRMCDIVPTDNPLKGERREGELLTLWEARSSKSILSNWACPPNEKHNAGKKTAASNIGKDAAQALKDLGVKSYGGEVEVKKFIVKLENRDKWKPAAHDTLYSQHLLEFNCSGKIIARMEAEGANGVDSLWVEMVTVPLEFPEEKDIEEKQALINELWQSLLLFEGGSLATWSTKTFASSSCTVIPNENLKNKLISTNEPLKLSEVGIWSNVPTSTKGEDRFTKMKNSAVCQGNFYIPLTSVLSENFKNAFTNSKNSKLWPDVTKSAAELAASITEGTEDKELQSVLAIHLWNSIWYSRLDTQADTKKDSWDLLPKTPVMDLVRGLKETTRTALQKWTGSCQMKPDEKADDMVEEKEAEVNEEETTENEKEAENDEENEEKENEEKENEEKENEEKENEEEENEKNEESKENEKNMQDE